MKLLVRRIELRLERYQAREPFGFGRVVVESAPCLMARATIELEGGEQASGLAADLLVPRWFDKSSGASPGEDARALALAAEQSGQRFLERGRWPTSLFALWHDCFLDCVEKPSEGPPELVRNFGVALIERALIDALCRGVGLSFHEALQGNLFEIEAERVHPALAGWCPRESLPAEPRKSLRVRHTIGLVDALSRGERRVAKDDGLPECLEDHLERYGLDAFKIKLCGDPATDAPRLLAIAELLQGRGLARPLFTLDANEQYSDLGLLLELVKSLAARPAGQYVLQHLAYFEQPLPRERALSRSVESGLRALAEYAPVVIDESDSSSSSFERAIACGYKGVSVKNCKGVFRALLHQGLCQRVGRGHFLCAEDLTTLPILPLQQDLATVAALGLEHVERNGHHYFQRLEHLSPSERAAALELHPDLYQDLGHGPELRIDRGRIEVGSLSCVGFGYLPGIEFERRFPIEEWVFE